VTVYQVSPEALSRLYCEQCWQTKPDTSPPGLVVLPDDSDNEAVTGTSGALPFLSCEGQTKSGAIAEGAVVTGVAVATQGDAAEV
jgi:hypothetical protein